MTNRTRPVLTRISVPPIPPSLSGPLNGQHYWIRRDYSPPAAE